MGFAVGMCVTSADRPMGGPPLIIDFQAVGTPNKLLVVSLSGELEFDSLEESWCACPEELG